MTDRHLRELERRWTRSGTEADQRLYFQELLRHGELEPDGLEVLAICGCPVSSSLLPEAGERELLTRLQLAQLARRSEGTITRWVSKRGCPQVKVGRTPMFDPAAVMAWRRQHMEYPEDVEATAWLLAGLLRRFDGELALRATLPVVRLGQDALERAAVLGQEGEQAEAWLAAAEDWALDPSRPRPKGEKRETRASCTPIVRSAREAARLLVDALRFGPDEYPLERPLALGLWTQIEEGAPEIPADPGRTNPALTAAIQEAYERSLRAIQLETVPWFLETGDPLAERVAQRGAKKQVAKKKATKKKVAKKKVAKKKATRKRR